MNAGTLQLQLPKKREGRVHDRKHIPDVEQPFKSLKSIPGIYQRGPFLGLKDGTDFSSANFEISTFYLLASLEKLQEFQN